ncbi:bifunctional adenosylcobinamide kinase/adenosylcobinamide-phosphate guanylyltransferase [Rhodoferax fermentans]|uniref:Bifunctional adenosylcobalamin biosynthesis protein n=1 Tax=Rhodoferax fermentans TaxID=28066 RepID=A0A1T1AW51_RHOFE|nr:bifunctional adenosylcobinamide kinase/adenosylcobinamide-phosphate guanylyltransferase [Rhodoferax fermentans]MBK1682781.1 adenosylcobinamide-phosphate guanylyltransferase [Rhodoferax fermentans]OOV08287.1 adenosylcobinamide-phosphate guanylyltransferase [Rhodoferax fermentans]
MTAHTIARSELILGGQKSGKSRRAELLARDWLGQSGQHQAVMIATARVWDEEMRQRIARHQADRAQHLSAMRTVEESRQLAQAIVQHSRADTLIVVDCLTLWLTNWLMPAELLQTDGASEAGSDTSHSEENQALAQTYEGQVAMLLDAIQNAPGPLVFVGNEIGLGVIPMGREVRAFVDALGLLNQSVARVCQRVTLMAAGLPLCLKDVA